MTELLEIWSGKSKHIYARQTNKFLNKFSVRKVEKVETYQMGSNKQVYNFSKVVGRVSRESRNKFMQGQTNRFLNKFFGTESRKVEMYQMGSNKQVSNFSKNVGRVSREIRNTPNFDQERREITKRERTIQFLII